MTPAQPATIRIELPTHLRRLANVGPEITLTVPSPVTQRTLLDALELAHPMLRGTLRDHTTHIRRPFIRFFACQQDLSLLSPDEPLPPAILRGEEPFLIIGAIAGG